jgi:hypothetical protein
MYHRQRRRARADGTPSENKAVDVACMSPAIETTATITVKNSTSRMILIAIGIPLSDI